MSRSLSGMDARPKEPPEVLPKALDGRCNSRNWPGEKLTGFGKPHKIRQAEVVEQADAPDSKSGGAYTPCGFDSRLRHHLSS